MISVIVQLMSNEDWIVDIDGCHIHPAALNAIVRSFAIKLDIKHFHFHCLRHKRKWGVTEELKDTDQINWVQMLNIIKSFVDEIIIDTLI